ncbi:hypothetical protein R3I93_004226 [Phoxinus phoxinus]|uniref:Uncharacterized protein n=1 Tax=Phoxinus phoxinus TaxID=58324 RepID=A0AAN9HB94_9TELE
MPLSDSSYCLDSGVLLQLMGTVSYSINTAFYLSSFTPVENSGHANCTLGYHRAGLTLAVPEVDQAQVGFVESEPLGRSSAGVVSGAEA